MTNKFINSIKLVIEKNLFLNDMIKSIVAFSYNRKMYSFVNECSNIDSIADFSSFAEYMKKIPANLKGYCYTIKRAFSENFLYGYATSFMKYANIENESMLYLPLLEHGIYLSKDINTQRYKMASSYIFQGKSNESIWKHRKDFRPIYYIGPYIHYANGYYSQEKIETIKKNKILLVFPPHSSEFDSMTFSFDDFNEFLLNKIGNNYDSIYACIYCQNTQDSYTKYLQSNGVRLVSAGFKLDPLFVCRLKTILEMSDTVLYPSFSSSIGYSYYLGKKIIYLDNESLIKWSSNHDSNRVQSVYKAYNSVKDAFTRLFSANAPSKTEEKYRLINHYWGLDQIKTPEELRNIYYENKNYILKHLGF